MQVSGTDGQRESRLVTDAFDVLELDPGRTAGLAHDRVRGLLAAGVEFGCSLFLAIGLDTIVVRACHPKGAVAEVLRGTLCALFTLRMGERRVGNTWFRRCVYRGA